MALDVNTPLYLVSVGTTSVTITLAAPDTNKYLWACIINTGADPVYVNTSTSSGTAVYPASSGTTSYSGDIITTGRHMVRLNPSHGFINLIRKAAATTADVAISLGNDY